MPTWVSALFTLVAPMIMITTAITVVSMSHHHLHRHHLQVSILWVIVNVSFIPFLYISEFYLLIIYYLLIIVVRLIIGSGKRY